MGNEELDTMFKGTLFTLKHKTNTVEYKNEDGKTLTRTIYIDLQMKEVTYIRSQILTRRRSKVMKFDKISDIVIPKTFEEFDEIIG